MEGRAVYGVQIVFHCVGKEGPPELVGHGSPFLPYTHLRRADDCMDCTIFVRQGRGCFSSAPLALFQRICHPVQGGGVVLIQQVGVDLDRGGGGGVAQGLADVEQGAPWAEATVAKVWRRP